LFLRMFLTLTTQQVAELFAHAQAVAPEECCGLLGGVGGQVGSIYPLRNVAEHPRRAYEAAPDELFAAQRAMRGRGEKLLGIYHSHPGQQEPQPSLTDVRMAFYPSAVYFIIGLGAAAVLRAFRLDKAAGGWERVEYEVKAE
jgi:proteasome lid subunit RPN8/RPN11